MSDNLEDFKLGWLPDLPDFRDFAFEGVTAPEALPLLVDLRASDAPVYNQGKLGSCTGNAIGAMFQFVNKKMGGTDFIPSRLFIYYEERRRIDQVKLDNGAYLRDGMKVIAKKGVCTEITWPYDVAKFAVKPSDKSYTEAKLHQAIEYKRINNSVLTMKQCLADGYPFVFGFTVYESFYSDTVRKTGVMPMPAKSEKAHGGHAVMAIGYDEEKKCFIVRNSWGTWWGDKGYFYMPYDYISNDNLANDFWTLRKVEK